MSSRVVSFIAVVIGCALLAIGYARWAAVRNRASDAEPLVTDPTALSAALSEPHLLFRSTTPGRGYGRLSVEPLSNPGRGRQASQLSCERLDMAAGTGVCLSANRDVFTTYSAVVFDRAFAPRHTLKLTGIPSRVRLSPNGRLAGITVFETGHSYAQAGFSTRTTIIETATGATLADLESFSVSHDRRPFRHEDFNFWGITFAADSNRFFATLSSAGVLYLVQGDVAARTAVVIDRDVECPSLSPDNQRIAYKKRQRAGMQLTWRVALLDLGTRQHRVLEAETRHVDDQMAWLGNDRILYAIPSDTRPGSSTIVVLPIDGGPPRDLVADAYSPAAVLQPVEVNSIR
jgi:hypothetical protein